MGAVHDSVWLAKLGLNQILVDGVVQQVLGCLSELELDDQRSRPPPVASKLQPDVMAAMLAVKYFAHQADKKPLTKVSRQISDEWQHSTVHKAMHLGNICHGYLNQGLLGNASWPQHSRCIVKTSGSAQLSIQQTFCLFTGDG